MTVSLRADGVDHVKPNRVIYLGNRLNGLEKEVQGTRQQDTRLFI